MAGYGGDIDDGTFGLDDKRGEGLCYGQGAPEVDVKDTFAFVYIGIQYGREVVATGVVDQVI